MPTYESIPSGFESKYIGPAKTITIAAAAAQVGGEVIEITADATNPLVGIVVSDCASGDDCEYYIDGLHSVKVTSAVVVAAGEDAYWDITANEAVDVGGGGTGDPFLGTFMTAAGSGVLEAVVWLNHKTDIDVA